MSSPRPLTVDCFEVVAADLSRPEGVCVGRDNDLWVSDQSGLLARIVDGRIERRGRGGVAPNGLALHPDGRVIVADYGGGLVAYDPAADRTEVLAREVAGRPVVWANYPAVDREGRIWCSTSTASADDLEAFRSGTPDGFVFTVEPGGATAVVSDGHRYANGVAFSADGEWLYVAESAAKQVVRARVDGGRLGPMERFGPVLPATPDGLAFDLAGNLWVSLVFEWNGLVVLDAGGRLRPIVNDPGAAMLRDPTNLAFGGADGCDLYVACCAGPWVVKARVAMPGLVLGAG